MKTGTVTTSVLRCAAVAAIVVALAGCSKAAATQKLAILTPTPRPTPTATPAPTPTATSSASASASASGSIAPTETPAGTTGPVGACTGTAEHLAFFAEAAGQLKFDVYCAALSAKWWLTATEYKMPNGGYLTISYKNSSGGLITVGEGNFCAGAPLCWSSASDLGTANFGDKAGSLKQLSGGQYAVFVDPGTTHGYQIVGKGVSQADFVAIAAAMVKVAKS
jgi:hypothetical protein